MKKLILASILSGSLFFPSAQAAFPTVKVESISGEYENKTGVAFAKYASYDLDVVKVEHSQLQVNFNNIDKNLVISDTNTSVRLKTDFSFLNVFKSMSFDGVTVRSNSKEFKTSLNELKVFIEPSEYVLRNMEISSDLKGLDVNHDEITMLDGLLLNGDITVETIGLASGAVEFFKRELTKAFPETITQKSLNKNLGLPLVGRNLRLVIKEESFSGSVLLDSWINAWLYLGGSLEHQKEHNELIITMKKARLGIFSVRGILLRTARNLALETVKVVGDKIIVDLDQVAASGQSSSK